MIKNLKIRTKILLVFFLIPIFVGVVSGFSYLELNKISQPLNKDIPKAIEEVRVSSNLDSLAQFIRYYDEVLTQSARNYAFTGDKKWENRYRDTDQKLVKVIAEAIKKGDTEDKTFFRDIDTANNALIELENKSMISVDRGDKKTAIDILEGKEYSDLKLEYKTSLEKYITRRGGKYEEALTASTEKIASINKGSEQIIKDALQQLILVSILAAILSIVLGIYLSRKITKPIKTLQEGAEEIRKGKLGVKIDINTNDEIGELALVFNQMTLELQQSHEVLEEKVEEKTKDLSQKVSELEKFKELTVGRELQMIELKKKIVELESKK